MKMFFKNESKTMKIKLKKVLIFLLLLLTLISGMSGVIISTNNNLKKSNFETSKKIETKVDYSNLTSYLENSNDETLNSLSNEKREMLINKANDFEKNNSSLEDIIEYSKSVCNEKIGND